MKALTAFNQLCVQQLSNIFRQGLLLLLISILSSLAFAQEELENRIGQEYMKALTQLPSAVNLYHHTNSEGAKLALSGELQSAYPDEVFNKSFFMASDPLSSAHYGKKIVVIEVPTGSPTIDMEYGAVDAFALHYERVLAPAWKVHPQVATKEQGRKLLWNWVHRNPPELKNVLVKFENPWLTVKNWYALSGEGEHLTLRKPTLNELKLWQEDVERLHKYRLLGFDLRDADPEKLVRLQAEMKAIADSSPAHSFFRNPTKELMRVDTHRLRKDLGNLIGEEQFRLFFSGGAQCRRLFL